MSTKRQTKAQLQANQRETLANRDLPSPFKEKVETVWKIISEMREEAEKIGIAKEFSADGRFLGDVGEIIAHKYFGIKLHNKQAKGQDGLCKVSNKKVEVKLRAKSTLVRVCGKPDVLLVIYLSPKTLKWGVVCNGSGEELLADAEKDGSDYYKTDVNKLIEAQSRLTTHSGIPEI